MVKVNNNNWSNEFTAGKASGGKGSSNILVPMGNNSEINNSTCIVLLQSAKVNVSLLIG